MTATYSSPLANRAASALHASLAGLIVWWDFEAVRLSPADAQRVVDAHGMSAEISVPVVTDEMGVRRAAHEFTHGGRSDRWRAEVVGDYTDGTLEVALLQHRRLSTDQHASQKVEWTQADSVVFDRNAHDWLYKGTTDAATAFVLLADERRGYLAHDWVRDNVVLAGLSKLGAFPLRRRQGGFYFVPAVHADQAEALAALVAALPCDAYLNVVHVAATSSTMAGVGQAAKDHIGAGLGDLKSRIAAWREATRAPRADALEGAMVAFSELRDLAALYRDGLQLELGSLQDEMDEANDALHALLGLSDAGAAGQLVTTLQALHRDHPGEPTPMATITSLGFPPSATGPRAGAWWGRERGGKIAAAAGLTATVTDGGLLLTPTEQVAA